MEITPFSKINLTEVKGVILDLDDTLYSYQTAHLKALEKCYEKWTYDDKSLEEFKSLYRTHRTTVTKQLSPQAACRSRIIAFQSMFENLGYDKPYVKAMEMSDLYWESLINNMILFPQAKDFLNRCKQKNILIAIATDLTMHIQVQKIQKLNIEDSVHFLITSEEAGAEKPDSKIFNIALDKLKLKSSEVIMVGDSYEKDIVGAMNLNIKSYQINQQNL